MSRARFQQTVLILVGATQIVTGVTQMFIDPWAFSTPVGISFEGPSALSAIRGVNGGIHLFVGLFVVLAAFKVRLRESGSWVALACCGGVVVGRLVSLVLDGVPNAVTWRYFTLEVLGALAIGGALFVGSARPVREHLVRHSGAA